MEPDEPVEPSNLPQLDTGADIRVLEGLEAIRLRPAMYIGGVDARGLETLVVDYLIAEFLLESADVRLRSLAVRLREDGSATVRVEGPLPRLGKEGWPDGLERAMTRIHCSGSPVPGPPLPRRPDGVGRRRGPPRRRLPPPDVRPRPLHVADSNARRGRGRGDLVRLPARPGDLRGDDVRPRRDRRSALGPRRVLPRGPIRVR